MAAAVESVDDHEIVLYGVVAASVVVVLILVAIIVLVLFRRNRNNTQTDSNSISLTIHPNSSLKNIKVEELLGSGNFGEWMSTSVLTLNELIGSVYRGNWEGTPVALKQLKSVEQFEEFAREAVLLESVIDC
jgi:hypothetical protein